MPVRLCRALFNSRAYRHARVGAIWEETNGGRGDGCNQSTEHFTATHQTNLFPVSGYPRSLTAYAEPVQVLQRLLPPSFGAGRHERAPGPAAP